MMASDSYQDELLTLPGRFTPGKIGVVTVLYNSSMVLPDFFGSIDRQTYSNIVVYCVDNASTDDSVQQCRARVGRYVVVANENNVGVAAGNNIGVRSAIANGCEHILFLNNDVAFGPDLFARLVEGLTRHHCAMTTPLIYYHDRPNIIWAAGGFFQPLMGNRVQHHGIGAEDSGQYANPRAVAYTPTCCVLVKRELFASVGLMDERYFAYFDDTDFMLRASRAKYELFYLPEAKLWHKVSSLTGTESPFTLRYQHRNHALFLHKHSRSMVAQLWSALYRGLYLCQWIVSPKARPSIPIKIRSWSEGIRAAGHVKR